MHVVFQRTALQELDANQMKVVRRMIKMARDPADSDSGFARKRNRAASQAVAKYGVIWSELWVKKTVSWVEHLWRHKESPAYALLQCQDDDWLRHARALSGRSLVHGTVDSGFLGLRGGPGKPIRWGQGWLERINPNNNAKDPTISRENFTKVLTMVQHGRWHGEAVEA